MAVATSHDYRKKFVAQTLVCDLKGPQTEVCATYSSPEISSP